MAAFQAAYGAKFGKAAAKITDDVDELLAFYDFPAEHKLIQSAQARWRAVNAPHLAALSAPAPASSAANTSNNPTTKPHHQPPKRS